MNSKMHLSQTELLDILRDLKDLQKDEFARLFQMKKAESLFRDFLTIKLDSICQSKSPYITSVHEYTSKKYDVAVLSGNLNYGSISYSPSTLIELKFTNIYWILKNAGSPRLGDINVKQNNIWRESYRLGWGTGIVKDLHKLTEAKKDYPSIDIHHVLALVNPRKPIPDIYGPLVNSMTEINKWIRGFEDEPEELFELAIETMTSQLNIVEKAYFPNRPYPFQIGSTSIYIGKAFDVDIYLSFIVISESCNI